MATIGKVAAVFSASTGDLEAGCDRAASSMRSLSGSLSSVASGFASFASNASHKVIHGIAEAAEHAAHTFYHMAESQAEVIDKNSKLADRLGLTYEELSGLKLAGDLADVSLDKLAKAMVKADVAFVRAGEGSKKATEALEGLGLSFEELNGKTTAERFEMIVDALAKIPSPAAQAEAAVTLFGKAGAELGPLFRKGAGEIEHCTEQAKKFGLALTNAQGKNVEEMNDSFKKVQESIRGIVGQVVANLAPAITKMTEKFVEFVGTIGGKNIGTAIADALIAGARVLAQVGDYFIKEIPPLWDKLYEVGQFWSGIWDAGRRVADLFFACWKAFETVGNFIGALFTKIIERLLRAAAAVVDWIPGMNGARDGLIEAADRWDSSAHTYFDAFEQNFTASANAFESSISDAAPRQGRAMAGPLVSSLDEVIARMHEARNEIDVAAHTPINVNQTVSMEGGTVTVEGLDGTSIEGVRQAIVDGESVQEQQLARLEEIRQALEDARNGDGGGVIDLTEADFAY